MRRQAVLRRVAVTGLVIALAASVFAALHHVRCSATIASSNETETEPDGGCIETYPRDIMLGAFALAAVSGISSASASAVLARRQVEPGARVLLALGAGILAISPILTLISWTSVGFDVNMATIHPNGRSYCTGPSGRPPFWLQASTCVDTPGLVSFASGVVVGLVGGVAAWRADRRLAWAAGALAIIHVVSDFWDPPSFLFEIPRLWLDVVLVAMMLGAALALRRPSNEGPHAHA